MRIRIALAAACAALCLSAKESPAAFIVRLDCEFSGATAPSGTAPWVTLTFADAGANTVRLTIDLNLQTSGEYLSQLNFNLDPDLDISGFAYVSGQQATSTVYDEDGFNADGSQDYDVEFQYPNSGDRFEGTEQSVYTITGAGITENSFDFLSTDNRFTAAAHIQGIGANGQFSGWVGDCGDTQAVPLPASLVMAFSGLVTMGGVGGLVRWRRKAIV